jgi:uncharacterized protein with von Willebrand factor type A (vWA) domain
MADGIQFALDSLNGRKEGHRFVFVITDGAPDGGHEPVIRRQVRLAKEAGIQVVGVGMGAWGAQGVQALFDESVYSEDLAALPHMLVKKLNDLIDRQAAKRGRKMRKE